MGFLRPLSEIIIILYSYSVIHKMCMLTLDGELVCTVCKEFLQHNKTNVLIKKQQ